MNLSAQSFMESETKNESSRIFFYGTSTINTTDELVKSLTGTQKFSVGIILKPLEGESGEISKGWIKGINCDISVNALNLKPNGVSKDSLQIISLMFPDAGNSGFMINPQLIMLAKQDGNNNSYNIGIDGSFALRHSVVNDIEIRDSSDQTISSESISFSALNYNIMPFFSYKYKKDDFDAFISIGIPIGFFNIPGEDVRDFKKLFPEDNEFFEKSRKSHIWSTGFKFVVGLNGFIFYADMRNNYKSKNFHDKNPLKGFVFNAGFAHVITIFKK